MPHRIGSAFAHVDARCSTLSMVVDCRLCRVWESGRVLCVVMRAQLMYEPPPSMGQAEIHELQSNNVANNGSWTKITFQIGQIVETLESVVLCTHKTEPQRRRGSVNVRVWAPTTRFSYFYFIIYFVRLHSDRWFKDIQNRSHKWTLFSGATVAKTSECVCVCYGSWVKTTHRQRTRLAKHVCQMRFFGWLWQWLSCIEKPSGSSQSLSNFVPPYLVKSRLYFYLHINYIILLFVFRSNGVRTMHGALARGPPARGDIQSLPSVFCHKLVGRWNAHAAHIFGIFLSFWGASNERRRLGYFECFTSMQNWTVWPRHASYSNSSN